MAKGCKWVTSGFLCVELICAHLAIGAAYEAPSIGGLIALEAQVEKLYQLDSDIKN